MRESSRGAVANKLDCDIVVSSNSSRTILFTCGLKSLGKIWTYMSYNQTGDISTLDGTPLKLVDKFTYLGSSVSSTEKDIDT